jgi:hypothetical protein
MRSCRCISASRVVKCLPFTLSISLLIVATCSCLAELPVAIDDDGGRELYNHQAGSGLLLLLEFLPLKWFPLCAFPIIFWIIYFECSGIVFHARHLFLSVISGFFAAWMLFLRSYLEDHELFLPPVPPTALAVKCNLIMLAFLVFCGAMQYRELRKRFGIVHLLLPLCPVTDDSDRRDAGSGPAGNATVTP